MSHDTWDTILFVNGILVMLSIALLVFATGYSIVTLDWHWFAYALGILVFLLCTEAIAGCYAD